MLLEKISGADKDFRASLEMTYWGGKIGSEPHPKYRYGCDVLPKGWKEIGLDDFAKSRFFWYAPIATGWLRTTIGDARLFFMHYQISYALIGDSHDGTVKIYQFGCEHKMDDVRVGNCLHRYTCKLCGFSELVDSSD